MFRFTLEPLRLVAAAAGFAGLTCLAYNQAAAKPEVAKIEIEEAKLNHIDESAAEFEWRVTGTALKTVTVRSIFFQQTTVNGIAIRIAPVAGPFNLKEGQEIRDLPVLKAVVAFREVPSLKPLRDIVRQGSARVHVSALVQVELNPIQLLLLRSKDVWIAMGFEQETPVEIPAGTLGRHAALAALSAAEPLWVLGNEGREWRRRRSTFASAAEEPLRAASVAINCRYEIRAKNGERRAMQKRSLGMALANGRVLTSAEAIEPWNFEAELAEAMSRHEIEVVEGSVDVVAVPVGQKTEYSLKRSEIRVLGTGAGAKRVISGKHRGTFPLRLRETEENAVLLELKGARALSGNGKASNMGNASEWEPAAVLRLDFEGDGQPQIWLTEMRHEGGRCVLKDPAGVTALGSAIWTEDGFAGILQSDSSGATLETLLRNFPLESF